MRVLVYACVFPCACMWVRQWYLVGGRILNVNVHNNCHFVRRIYHWLHRRYFWGLTHNFYWRKLYAYGASSRYIRKSSPFSFHQNPEISWTFHHPNEKIAAIYILLLSCGRKEFFLHRICFVQSLSTDKHWTVSNTNTINIIYSFWILLVTAKFIANVYLPHAFAYVFKPTDYARHKRKMIFVVYQTDGSVLEYSRTKVLSVWIPVE